MGMQLKVSVSPRTIVKYLVIGVVFFAVVSTGIQICKYVFDYRDGWMKLFNLDRELNFPTWYSTFMLGFCAVLLRIISAGKKQKKESLVKDWRLLSLIFTWLAIDELLSIHEILIIPEVSEALNLPWFLHSMWVIVGIVFVAWFIKRYSPFVRRLPSTTKKHFIIAAAIYIGGALVMEMVGSHLAESQGQQYLPYALVATVEEIMEMAGIVTFIYGLLHYLENWANNIDLKIEIKD